MKAMEHIDKLTPQIESRNIPNRTPITSIKEKPFPPIYKKAAAL